MCQGLKSPLPIKKDEKASLFVQEIRDEAHRFAITYNRLLRQKSLIPLKIDSYHLMIDVSDI